MVNQTIIKQRFNAMDKSKTKIDNLVITDIELGPLLGRQELINIDARFYVKQENNRQYFTRMLS